MRIIIKRDHALTTHKMLDGRIKILLNIFRGECTSVWVVMVNPKWDNGVTSDITI